MPPIWIQANMDVVFFVYGLAFVVMGISILVQPKPASEFKIAGILWLLAGFGLTHGFNEWLDMWAIIKGRSDVFDLLRWFVVVVSYVFLFEFGRRLVRLNSSADSLWSGTWLGWWTAPVIVLSILVAAAVSSDFWKTGSTLARYFLCFPGALLTGFGFFAYYRRECGQMGQAEVERYFTWAGLSFVAYGILGGLIVPKGGFFPAAWLNTDAFVAIFHMPVQIFRAAVAVMAAAGICGILRIFHWEADARLRESLDREHESRTAFERLSRQYHLILDSVGEGIFGVDAAGNATFFNSAAARMTGYGLHDLKGRDIHSIIHHSRVDNSPYPAAECPVRRTIEDGDPRKVGGEVYWRRDGSCFPVEYVVTPIRKDQSPEGGGAVVVFSDSTERVHAEEEREKLRHQLFQAQKMDAVGALAAGVAHDFNNLLTVIQGNADISMSRADQDESTRRDLKKIHDASVRAAGLTRQLLLFARRQPMEILPVNLNETIDNLLRMLGRIIGERVRVITDLASGLWILRADEGNLEQVLMNLMINARDAMPQGGTVTITTENVVLDEKSCAERPGLGPGRYARLSIADTGEGMDEETASRVFEPFFTTKGPGKGTGLGLAVVYGIIKQHDGYVYVDSKPGKGTVFSVFLPAVDLPTRTRTASAQVSPELRGNGEKILIVEDNREVREFAARALEENGYLSVCAACAKEAMEKLGGDDGGVRLVISDVGLPDANGLELMEQIHSRLPHIPVILWSGYTGNGSAHDVIRQRGVVFLAKPFGIVDLLKAVKEKLTA